MIYHVKKILLITQLWSLSANKRRHEKSWLLMIGSMCSWKLIMWHFGRIEYMWSTLIGLLRIHSWLQNFRTKAWLLLFLLYPINFYFILFFVFLFLFFGWPRRSVRYKHRYSSVISENEENVRSSQEPFESGIVIPIDDMPQHETDQNVVSHESELAGKWHFWRIYQLSLKPCYFPLS